MIYFGNSSVKKIYFGTQEVQKMYLGNDLIYSAQPQPSDITVHLAGLDQTGYGYYKVNNGSETEIPAANYITFPATKEKCDADGITLTGVTSLEVYSTGEDMAYCHIYDTSFEYATGISAYEWVDITQYLRDGYYVLVESNN